MYMYTPGDGTGSQYPLRGTLIRNGEFPTVSRNTYIGLPNWNTVGGKEAMIEYLFKHSFNNYVSFSQNFRWERSDYTTKDAYFNTMESATEEQVRPWAYHTQDNTIGLDNRIFGKFSTGPLQHTWVVGSDFRSYSYSQNTLYDRGTAPIINIYNPSSNYTPCFNIKSSDCQVRGSNGSYDYFQEGVYFQDQIKWKKLSVIIGGREDWVNYNSKSIAHSNINTGGIVTTTETKNAPQPAHAFTWRGGILYSFDFGLTPYFSYSTSFIPQTSTDYQGQPFSPLTGKQLEAGLKYKIPNKDVLITAAAFHIDEDHYLISDLVHTGFSTDGGRVRSQGFEVSANANITKDLRLVASYTYNDIRFAKTNKTSERYNPYTDANYGTAISQAGMSVPYVPRNMFSIFADYTLPRNIAKGFGLNWGMRYVGFTYIDNVESFKTKPYALFDIGAHYDFGSHFPYLRGLKAQISISNLTNKYYVTSCATSICYVGQGRKAYGNITYNW
ncbi:ferric iron siderophore receptor [Novacetimonas maltaceti]|uniref:Ferrichrome-iron receptor n=1 Tax=Novacetimonas maltaceti TaxID=1203393 RepID=A0A2S3VX27_9PROT|nr:TonB-dependent receptor [Novacetimonas maltaceti]POF61156.1 Ferrichrome-iron receptor precursor [Novacetimonas maltaceti]PYD57357.1 ferric iron siderophore receptor [Novacetimonas maltaceti]